MPATFCARSCVIRSWFSGSYATLPVSFCFSSPPMRCSSPGVPGIAHGRASVSGSRLYGRNSPPSPCANSTWIGSSSPIVGDPPRLGAVREVRIREQVDGRAIRERDACRLDRRVEAVAGCRRSEHRHRRLAVPAEEHHQQIRLLGLRRHAGRRPGALNVDDHERQLERHRKPDRLRLEDDARPGGRRHAERAAERRAERRADGRDLVLRLERPHAERLVTRELFENRRCGRDRVRAEEEIEARQLRRGDQPLRQRGVAGDLAIAAGGSFAGFTSYWTANASDVSPKCVAGR